MKTKYYLLSGILILIAVILTLLNTSALEVHSCTLSVNCKGFLANSSLNVEMKNHSVFPKVAFLELRSPAIQDYMLEDWKVETNGIPSTIQKLLRWIGAPLKQNEFKLFVPIFIGSKSNVKMEIDVNQIIRNRLDLPLFRITGSEASLPWDYSINFDPEYEGIHSSLSPQVLPQSHNLNFHLKAGTRITPRFEWDYQQVLPIQASMG